MYIRWIGIVFLLGGLVFGLLIASEFKVYTKEERFAVLAEDKNIEIKDKIVMVPPWNRTEKEANELNLTWGWVGFNISLPNQGKFNYNAEGIILHAKVDEKPRVVMRIVNETGLDLLLFDYFSDPAWNASKVYAVAALNATIRSFRFPFLGLDNCSKYCVLFRGLDNSTEDFEILISIKESWFNMSNLLQKNEVNAATAVTLIATGSALILISFKKRKNRKKWKKKLRK